MSHLHTLLTSLLLFANTAVGQSEKPPYTLPSPKGWARETIALPPAFAPGMAWKGTEDIRFAPGMFKPDSDTFFSYALVFWLPDDQKVDAKTMEKELLAYYRGLAKAVLKGKKQEADEGKFTLNVKDNPVKADKRGDGEVISSCVGELKWIEPFATGKEQTLRLEIQTWHCEKQKHHCVFLCVSPTSEESAVWKSLREIRTGFTCP
ncbi:hypothetical protein [Zavarzinella formosa]|uniref:hypothetical protein n=1 Tax=Zavarzinella formosa TaxID=360055 RepID=UPI000300BBD1|nr:hypothetical protein [Zavarzinella formosa]